MNRLALFFDVIREDGMETVARVGSEVEARQDARVLSDREGKTFLIYKQEFVDYAFARSPSPQQQEMK
jgi:hypothetical protein